MSGMGGCAIMKMNKEPEYHADLLVGAQPWAIEQVKEDRELLEGEIARLKQTLSDIHTFAHCTAKAGPLNTPDLQDAWSKFMQISAMATNGLAGTKPKQESGWKS